MIRTKYLEFLRDFRSCPGLKLILKCNQNVHNKEWLEGNLVTLKVNLKLSKIIDKNNYGQNYVQLEVIDATNQMYSIRVYLTDEELSWLSENPYVYTVVSVYGYGAYAGKFLSCPIGVSVYKNVTPDKLSVIPKVNSTSLEVLKDCYNNAYAVNPGISEYDTSKKESRLGFIIVNDEYINEYFYDTYCPSLKPKSNFSNWMEEHIAKLDVFDYNSENKSIDEELDTDIKDGYKKEKREYDPQKNSSKVYAGLKDETGNIVGIKETNLLLMKNKNSFSGMDATEVRIKEYERLLEIAKTKYKAASIVLMEKHWVRTLIPEQKSIIDLDGIKRNALHQIIDYKTHRRTDNLMYSQNGNVIVKDKDNSIKIYESERTYYSTLKDNEYGDR